MKLIHSADQIARIERFLADLREDVFSSMDVDLTVEREIIQDNEPGNYWVHHKYGPRKTITITINGGAKNNRTEKPQ